MARWFVTCAVILAALVASSAFAGYGDSISRKADRGFSNALGGWLEIPYQTCAVSKERGILSGATLGTCKGIALTPLRMVSGVIDIVTFPFPFPKGWNGLIRPEYNPWVEEPATPE